MRQPIVMEPETDPLGEAALGLVQGLTTGLLHGQQMKMQRQQQRQKREEDLRWQMAQQTGDFSILEEQIPLDAIEDFEQAFGRIQEINERREEEERRRPVKEYTERFDMMLETIGVEPESFPQRQEMLAKGMADNLLGFDPEFTGEYLFGEERKEEVDPITVDRMRRMQNEYATVSSLLKTYDEGQEKQFKEMFEQVYRRQATDADIRNLRNQHSMLRGLLEEHDITSALEREHRLEMDMHKQMTHLMGRAADQWGVGRYERFSENQWATILNTLHNRYVEAGYTEEEIRDKLMETYADHAQPDDPPGWSLIRRALKRGEWERVPEGWESPYGPEGESPETQQPRTGQRPLDDLSSIIEHATKHGVEETERVIEGERETGQESGVAGDPRLQALRQGVMEQHRIDADGFWLQRDEDGEFRVHLSDRGFMAIMNRPGINSAVEAREYISNHGLIYED